MTDARSISQCAGCTPVTKESAERRMRQVLLGEADPKLILCPKHREDLEDSTREYAREKGSQWVKKSEGDASYWKGKAHANVEEWGIQSVDTVLLALLEELGEVTQAHLEARAEDGDPARVQAELDDLAPLLWQLQWAIEAEYGE